ncbi:MAG: NAD-dependent epimerase/dehydratase family protein [Candidatus Binataceae bacterium]
MIAWITSGLAVGPFDEAEALPGVAIIDVRDLTDGAGNRPEQVETKLKSVVAAAAQGKTVVCCDYGISRSNAIAAGALARMAHIPFNDAVRRVAAATGRKAIQIEMLLTVRQLVDNPGVRIPRANRADKNILVTGGSGAIGRALLPVLERRFRVFAPSRQQLNLAEGPLDLELLVNESESKLDFLIHLANPRIEGPSSALGESVNMFHNVCEVCARHRIHLLWFSSWVVYNGYRANHLLADEALPMCPRGTPSESKYLCETLLAQCKFPYTLLRLPRIYGPHMAKPKFLYNFRQKARLNEEIQVHRYLNGLPFLDMLYIDDLVRLVVCCLERELQGVFNAGSGVASSTTEIAQLVIAVLESRSAIHEYEIDGYTTNILMDGSRASEQLGWQPAVGFADGLRRTLTVIEAA